MEILTPEEARVVEEIRTRCAATFVPPPQDAIERSTGLVNVGDILKRLYAPVLHFTMTHKLAVILFAVSALVVAFGLIAPQLGSEFVPRLSEGAIVVNVVRLAGTDLAETNRYNTQM